jgi:RhoGEF domain
VTELLRTESSYLQSLQELKSVFFEPMSMQRELFHPKVLENIFCNLATLLKVTEDTLNSFQATQSIDASKTVGEVFLNMVG